jgi:hypothetical protein
MWDFWKIIHMLRKNLWIALAGLLVFFVLYWLTHRSCDAFQNNVSISETSKWRCLPGISAPLQKNMYGDVECMSMDYKNCLWGPNCNDLLYIPSQYLKPLACGDMHKSIYGNTGYDNPKHWCTKGDLQIVTKTITLLHSNPYISIDNRSNVDIEFKQGEININYTINLDTANVIKDKVNENTFFNFFFEYMDRLYVFQVEGSNKENYYDIFFHKELERSFPLSVIQKPYTFESLNRLLNYPQQYSGEPWNIPLQNIRLDFIYDIQQERAKPFVKGTLPYKYIPGKFKST